MVTVNDNSIISSQFADMASLQLGMTYICAYLDVADQVISLLGHKFRECYLQVAQNALRVGQAIFLKALHLYNHHTHQE